MLEMEQLARVAVGDLDPVRFADRSVVEPVGRLGHIIVRVIHRITESWLLSSAAAIVTFAEVSCHL